MLIETGYVTTPWDNVPLGATEITLPLNGRPGTASKVMLAVLPTATLATSVSSTVTSTRMALGSTSVMTPVAPDGAVSPGLPVTVATTPSNGASKVLLSRSIWAC